jgi:putative Mg2+ transporter-C (MgtC) family protein
MEFAEFFDRALWTRIAIALLCGGVIGLERQLRGKPAGMRTSSLICLGTAMFVHLGTGFVAEGGDPTRVLGQVVTGIGFLGAGVIMTRDGLLTGVTSAAVVWVLAASGAAIGAGRYAAAVAMSVVTVAVLVGVESLEHAFVALRRGVHATSEDPESNEGLGADDGRSLDGQGLHQAATTRERPFRSSGAPPALRRRSRR